MLSSGCNYSKLKTNLRLAINRLKLLEKKKTELAQKSRKEIADYLANGKIERCKIRIEHTIREDYLVEAMEVIEIYCDLLLARFGLVRQMKDLDAGLEEAISSVMWAAPRLQTDVVELKAIADQLAVKYGRQYALAARENALNSVNEKLVRKLSVQTPSKVLVEKYLIEIAKSHEIPYEPDAGVLAEEIADKTISNVPLIELDDYKPPQPGFVIGLTSDNNNSAYSGAQYPQQDFLEPFNYPNPDTNVSSKGGEVPLSVPAMPPSEPYPKPGAFLNKTGFDADASAPSYESVFETDPAKPSASVPSTPTASDPSAHSEPNASAITQTPSPRSKFPVDILSELPPVPNTTLPDLNDPNNEVDFDDLVERFKQLKNRK